ncbi:MAG: hypothetical protein ABIO72_03995 [Patescibacteria group bacterium]
MRNQIVEKTPTHKGLTAGKIAEIIKAISAETGIVVKQEVQRRFLYDPDKTWRVHLEVTYQGKLAVLRIENMKLEIDEESIREKFRAAASGLNVRPPYTYAFAAFNDAKGYAWSIDELVEGHALFLPEADPAFAVQQFIPFYKELRSASLRPFWPAENVDAEAFSVAQLAGWMKLAQERNPDTLERHAKILGRLSERIVIGMKKQLLSFQHAHLAGSDVRVTPQDDYVVFANEFWSWRQPGYSLVFPIWNQWLALDDACRTHEHVQEITNTWLEAIERELVPHAIASTACVETMLLNRIFGSLILDLPAQLHRHSKESVAALEEALIREAEQLMTM